MQSSIISRSTTAALLIVSAVIFSRCYRINGSQVIEASTEGSPGEIDKSFGVAGLVYGATQCLQPYKWSLSLQSTGHILAAGTICEGGDTKFALFRYNSDGTPDADFGQSGMRAYSINNQAYATASAILSDGSIAMIGSTLAGASWDFSAIKLKSDGALDGSFGAAGIATIDVTGGNDYAYALAVGEIDKLYIAGIHEVSADRVKAKLVGLAPDGTKNLSFGDSGIVTFDGEKFNSFKDVKFASNTLFAVGSAGDLNEDPSEGFISYSAGRSHRALIAKYSAADGSRVSFKTYEASPKTATEFTSMARYGGYIFAAGYKNDGTTNTAVMARIRESDLSLDPSFGENGWATLNTSLGATKFTSVSVGPDGAIRAAGKIADTPSTKDTSTIIAAYDSLGRANTNWANAGLSYDLTKNFNHYGTSTIFRADGSTITAGPAAAGNQYGVSIMRNF